MKQKPEKETTSKQKFNGSDLLTAIQISSSKASSKPIFEKRTKDVTKDTILASYNGYSIESKTQKDHDATHMIGDAIVKAMLNHKDFRSRVIALASKYKLNLLKPCEFTVSGERIPLVYDYTFHGIEIVKDDKGNRFLQIDSSNFLLIPSMRAYDIYTEVGFVRDLIVNYNLAQTPEERELSDRSFCDNFVYDNLKNEFLRDRALVLKVLDNLGLLLFDVDESTHFDVYSRLSTIYYKIEKSSDPAHIDELIEALSEINQNPVYKQLFERAYVTTYLGADVKDFGIYVDKDKKEHTERTEFFEEVVARKCELSYKEYQQSIFELGNLIWEFYSKELDQNSQIEVDGKVRYPLNERITQLENDIAIYKQHNQYFEESYLFSQIKIDEWVAKSHDLEDTKKLHQQFQDYISKTKQDIEYLEEYIEKLKKEDPEFLETQRGKRSIWDLNYQKAKLGNKYISTIPELVEIFDQMERYYGVENLN
ncbi:MAG: hypothetical protein ACRCXZ_08145 [Patescibacteria group bacterium]